MCLVLWRVGSVAVLQIGRSLLLQYLVFTRGLFFAWPASPGAWKTFVKHKKQIMKETINGFSLSPFAFVNFQQEFKEKMENSICQKKDRNNWE